MGLASFAALLNTRLYKLSLIQRRLRVALYGSGALDGTLSIQLCKHTLRQERLSIAQAFHSSFFLYSTSPSVEFNDWCFGTAHKCIRLPLPQTSCAGINDRSQPPRRVLE